MKKKCSDTLGLTGNFPEVYSPPVNHQSFHKVKSNFQSIIFFPGVLGSIGFSENFFIVFLAQSVWLWSLRFEKSPSPELTKGRGSDSGFGLFRGVSPGEPGGAPKVPKQVENGLKKSINSKDFSYMFPHILQAQKYPPIHIYIPPPREGTSGVSFVTFGVSWVSPPRPPWLGQFGPALG